MYIYEYIHILVLSIYMVDRYAMGPADVVDLELKVKIKCLYLYWITLSAT